MKMKSLAMLAISLLTAFGCIAPALADDAMSGQTMQPAPATTDTNLSNQDNSAQNSTSNGASSTTSSSTDEASPDTASGDDDY